MIVSKMVVGAMLACGLLASVSANADVLNNYSFNGASFNDLSSLNGSFTIDWTKNTVQSIDVLHGAGTVVAPTGGPAGASVFSNVAQISNFWNIGAQPSVGDSNIWEIKMLSNDSTQQLNLDFYKPTGALYIGNANAGTNLDTMEMGYVALTNVGNSSVSAVPLPKSSWLMMVGMVLVAVRVATRQNQRG